MCPRSHASAGGASAAASAGGASSSASAAAAAAAAFASASSSSAGAVGRSHWIAPVLRFVKNARPSGLCAAFQPAGSAVDADGGSAGPGAALPAPKARSWRACAICASSSASRAARSGGGPAACLGRWPALSCCWYAFAASRSIFASSRSRSCRSILRSRLRLRMSLRKSSTISLCFRPCSWNAIDDFEPLM